MSVEERRAAQKRIRNKPGTNFLYDTIFYELKKIIIDCAKSCTIFSKMQFFVVVENVTFVLYNKDMRYLPNYITLWSAIL